MIATKEQTPVREPVPQPPVLLVRNLYKTFGGRTVLAGFELDVAAGELVALLGANGSGKSTALRCVAGLVKPDDGQIEVRRPDGGAGVAMVFQQFHLVRRRSALANVCAGALGRLPLSRSWGVRAFPARLKEEAMACLDRVGLADRAHMPAGRLSGGQQQRVAIARALCQRSPVLLADEPVSALDPAAAEQVMALLRSLAHDDGMAVAAVLHQPDLAERHADRVIGLRGGVITFDTPADRLDGGQVAGLYLPDGALS
ncbi:phosphonate ABC transporter ATP-binding protein [Microlunatus parietis]|uniref:Phosphonate transport system ATP-binding protein n=1 Tax=Microlunatus parietis TaxID=682979 RepID=A0A7Y9LDZ8_9ACTN|nr:ATP-binding cassette domain-containing protein [Microlunatus parietis]NYE74447.1 phosphonate transport system ATP-binding protein [Microlunatus parietis]